MKDHFAVDGVTGLSRDEYHKVLDQIYKRYAELGGHFHALAGLVRDARIPMLDRIKKLESSLRKEKKKHAATRSYAMSGMKLE